MTTTESLIERDLITKLEELKYTYRPDIRDRATLGKKPNAPKSKEEGAAPGGQPLVH